MSDLITRQDDPRLAVHLIVPEHGYRPLLADSLKAALAERDTALAREAELRKVPELASWVRLVNVAYGQGDDGAELIASITGHYNAMETELAAVLAREAESKAEIKRLGEDAQYCLNAQIANDNDTRIKTLDEALREITRQRDSSRCAVELLTAELATVRDSIIRRTGSSSWEEFIGIWDPTEETAVDAIKRLREREKRLTEALAIYADKQNWVCARCGKRDEVNCGLLRYTGPVDLEGYIDGHGFTPAEQALAKENTQK